MTKRLFLLAAATALLAVPVAADNITVLPGYTSSVLSGIPPALGTCSTSHSLSDTDDLVVCGKLEVDEFVYLDDGAAVVENDATDSGVTDVLTLSHTTSAGTFGADGIGTGLVFKSEDDAGTEAEIASIDAIYTDTDNTSEDSQINFNIKIADAAKTPLIIGPTGIKTDYILSQDSNTFLGVGAVPAGLTHGSGNQGYNNTLIGYNTGKGITSGYGNMILGYGAGYQTTEGYENTFIGRSAGYNNIVGHANVCIGMQAQPGKADYNVALGYYAMNAIDDVTADNNVAIGSNAARYLNNKSTALTDLDTSVFLGALASANGQGDTNEIVIGYNASGRGSHTTTIGNTDTTSWMMYGGMVVETESVTCSTDACAYNAAVVSSYYTTENAGGADVVTVTDGTAGQVRRFVLKADGTDDLTLTPTNLANGTSITMDTAGESVTLEFDGTNWFIISGYEYAVVP